MTTTVPEGTKEGSSLADSQEAGSTAQMRARAISITPEHAASLLRGWAGGPTVTQRVRRAGEVASILGSLANKPGTVLHSQPPTFWQAWDRHRECAGHFGTPLLRWLRLAWGCLHLLAVLPPLYLLAWITESPLRLFLTSALIAAIWLWS